MKVMKKVVRIMFFAFVVQMFLLNSVKRGLVAMIVPPVPVILPCVVLERIVGSAFL